MQPPSGGCVLKRTLVELQQAQSRAAASARLCVETLATPIIRISWLRQPPSGCVLKRELTFANRLAVLQPPSGGCVLKQLRKLATTQSKLQPPSGGCVLKPYQYRAHGNRFTPATFGGYTLKQILINLNSIIFTFLLYLSTRFIPNNIPPCISPLFALDYAPFLAFIIYNYACF